jgi:membrane protease YdiL (CAAX protease family)
MNTMTQASGGENTPVRAVILGLFFLLAGLAIFLFGWPYYDIFPTSDNVVYSAALAAFFGLLALAMRRGASTARYVPAAYALFIAAAANLVLVIGPLNRFAPEGQSPPALLATDKLIQFFYVVPVILVLNRAAGRKGGDIFLQRGQPRRWLPFGLASLAVFAAVVGIIALSQGATPAELLALLPYALVFITANATMEELWFRGIFLRPYGDLIGPWGATVVTALVFAVSHVNRSYIETGLGLPFGLAVLVLGLVTAWIMRHADSLWGAVLSHMGADLLVIFPILASI